MSKINYKKEIEILNKKVIDLKIKQHKEGYIHIPSINKDRLLCFIAMLGSGLLAWLNLYLLDWNVIKTCFSSNEVIESFSWNINQLINIYPLIGEYILIALIFICLAGLIKGGFSLLNKYNENGLIVCLIVCLIVGLIGGLIFGLIVGLIVGFSEEFK